LYNTECPTRYRTRHFFNNFTTNEDIATKFKADLPRVTNVKTTNVLMFKFRCNIFIGVRIIKEIPGSVASGTPCTFEPRDTHIPHSPSAATLSSICLKGAFYHRALCVSPQSLHLNIMTSFKKAKTECSDVTKVNHMSSHNSMLRNSRSVISVVKKTDIPWTFILLSWCSIVK
jgi:hypothetical protein